MPLSASLPSFRNISTALYIELSVSGRRQYRIGSVLSHELHCTASHDEPYALWKWEFPLQQKAIARLLQAEGIWIFSE